MLPIKFSDRYDAPLKSKTSFARRGASRPPAPGISGRSAAVVGVGLKRILARDKRRCKWDLVSDNATGGGSLA